MDRNSPAIIPSLVTFGVGMLLVASHSRQNAEPTAGVVTPSGRQPPVFSRGWEVKTNTFGTRGPRAKGADGKLLPSPATNVQAFADTFPGNFAEIVLVGPGGIEAVALAEGQYPTPNGTVVAAVRYDPEGKKNGLWTDYPGPGVGGYNWMAPEGTLVALGPADIDYLRGPDGSKRTRTQPASQPTSQLVRPYRAPLSGENVRFSGRLATFGASPTGQISAGECDYGLLGKVIWPSDVDRFKERINPYFEGADASVKTCGALPAADKAQWNAFITNWRAYKKRVTPTFGSANEFELTCAYSFEMDKWREHLKKYCALGGPEPPTVQKKGETLTDLSPVVRWLGIGALALGGVALIVTFAPEIKALAPKKAREP